MMKKILIAGFIGLSALLVGGCGDGLTDREESCLAATGNIDCKSAAELELEKARIQANADVQIAKAQGIMNGASAPMQSEVAPGQYTNYYGDERYGQWKQDGTFQFNDPTSSWAESTNAFLLGAGLGGLAGYMATKAASRGEWKKSYPNGYTPKTYTTKTYMDKSGKTISKSEYERRVAQSNKDRMKYQMEQNRKKFNSSKPQVGYKPAAKPTMVKPGQPNPQVKYNTPVRKPVYQPKMKPFKPSYGGSSKKRK
ncbi:putative coil containing protein [Aeromonas phage LAh_8]|uniref:Putative coil containing protein n=1 Tax=Aeromonas phage LAh_8 TaxID=2591032 RepID=A0A514A0D9_9CAUD|nr:putative coil containing protein [Aeromonas phage LAh_8]QDH46750.1 putative coil containing protein [Aeromonas phage LAh_8]